jgi:hypothetical protein
MPSILLIPFVFIFGSTFSQTLFANAIGAAVTTAGFLVGNRVGGRKLGLVVSTVIGLSSIVWFMSSVGSAWYLGQLTSLLFLLLALYESLGKKRSLIVGLLIGASYLSRVHTLLLAPFFALLLVGSFYKNKKINTRKIVNFIIGISVFVSINAAYNYLRFGQVWDVGYTLIPGIWQEPWCTEGMLSASYIWAHLEILLFRIPNLSQTAPFITPSWYGLAIWITTPIFLTLLFVKKNMQFMLSFSVLCLFLLFSALKCGTGWTQFGYRYALEGYVVLIYLLTKSMKVGGIKPIHIFLLFLGVIVNLWGVLFINKFGWVGF